MKTYSYIKSLLLLAVLLLSTSILNLAFASELYFIDAHSQLDHTIANPELLI